MECMRGFRIAATVGFCFLASGFLFPSQASEITIHGTIIDSLTRSGVSSVQVEAYILTTIPYSLQPQKTNIGYDSTDALGAYRIAGTYVLTNSSGFPSYMLRRQLVVEVTAEKYGNPAVEREWNLLELYTSVVNADFTILRAFYGQGNVSFQGQVLDKLSGAPMSGVRVDLLILKNSGWGYSFKPLNYWITGTDGRFAFIVDQDPSADAYSLSASMKGYSAPDTIIKKPSSGSFAFPYNCTLRIERDFATINGTVRDSLTNALLQGATVYLRELVFSTLNPDSCLGYYSRDTLTTGQNGAFQFDSVRLFRKYNVVAVQKGYSADSFFINAEQSVTNPVFTAPLFIRPCLASLAGTLRESLTQRAVKLATVYLMGDIFRRIGNIWVRGDTIYDSALTGVNGRYYLDSIADDVLYFLTVRAPGYYQWRDVDITFEGGFRKTLDLTMVMHTGFKGVVTDSISGAPVGYSKVLLTNSMRIPGIPPRFISFTVDSMVTDSNGAFAFALDTAEMMTLPLSIVASKNGYTTKSVNVALVESTVTDVPIRLYSGLTRAQNRVFRHSAYRARMCGNRIHCVSPGYATLRIYGSNGRLLAQKAFFRELSHALPQFPASVLILEIVDGGGVRLKEAKVVR